jgi:hypothetical protein
MANCKTCGGKGAVKCPVCKGTGRVGGDISTNPRQCDNCKGSGVVKCKACNGKGYIVVKAIEGNKKMAQLKNLYVLRDENTIHSFLQEYAHLVDLLLEAYQHIEIYFGSNPRVFLEVVIDPEATNDRQLVAYIRTDLPPDEALSKLQQLDERWWLDAMDRSEGKLCVHIEFS